jgi:hypothetical protein
VGVGKEAVASVITHDFYERPVKARKNELDFEDRFHGGQRLGVGYYQSNSPTVGYVLVPIWVIWGLASIPLLFAFLKWAKKRWRRKGNLCVNCGYDLRGSSRRCPECGNEVGQALPDQRPVRPVVV